MSFTLVVFGYPVILAVLCIGSGLLVERLGGWRFPARLVPVAGFGALIVVSQFTVLSGAIAPLTPWALVVVALIGFAVARRSVVERWRARAPRWWAAPLAGIAAYVTVGLPVIAAGRLTFPGYLIDTTAGIQLAGGEWILHHGVQLPHLYPAYGEMLAHYFGSGYPAGGQVLLAATGWLSGQDLLWLYFPFQVFSVALAALVLTYLAERAGLSRAAAGFAGWIAAVPALVTAYAMMGSIKELTALPLLLLLGAMIPLARAQVAAGVRAVIPFGVAAAGAIGAIGPAAAAWIAIFAVFALVAAWPAVRSRWGRFTARTTGRTLVAGGAAAAVLVVALALPTVTRLSASVNAALGFSKSNAAAVNDPGSLLRPLRFVQAFGVWLGYSHRVDPEYLTETYLLIGFAIACFVFGIFWLVRRRSWTVLAFVLGSLIVWAVLYHRGTEWTSAKVMMLTTPVIVLVAMVGALRSFRSQRVLGLLMAGVLGAGVLASDALLYHGTNMAPVRFVELRSIGQRFANRGPTLLPDFDEYTFYLLRKLDVDSPGFAFDMRRHFALFGPGPQYGDSYDIDDIPASWVQQFKMIVMRRSPRWSRPPGDYELVWAGHFYDVWRQTGPVPRFHLPVGTGMQATGVVACRRIRSIARQAAASGRPLRYASRPPNVIAPLRNAGITPELERLNDQDGFPEVSFGGPGSVTSSFGITVPGTYQLWLGGAVDRHLHVLIDHAQAGASASARSGGDGNMIYVGPVHLDAGRHVIKLLRSGGSLAPGDDAGSLIDGIYLAPTGADHETVATIRPQAWRTLCGRSLDWLEIA
jgi:hypothetical protein